MPIFLGVEPPAAIGGMGALAAAAEQMGYDGIAVPELAHDPMIALTLASTSTERVRLATGVLIAFARNPMTVAMQAADVHAASQGRLALGLGSQIQPHIEKRFSMPWGKPAARMREFVQALHEIWDAFESGERLDFRGEFYHHTLLTPMFSPRSMPFGRPPVWLAGVGELMTRVAGEVADGFVPHSFTTGRYLREVSIPALEAGRRRAGRAGEAIEVIATPLVAVGSTDEERASAVRAVRKQVAFYGSTPAYRAVMELHGWGDLADELHGLSRRGEWDAMGEALTDEIFAEFAIAGTPAEVAEGLAERYGDVATTACISPLGRVTPETLAALRAELRLTWPDEHAA